MYLVDLVLLARATKTRGIVPLRNFDIPSVQIIAVTAGGHMHTHRILLLLAGLGLQLHNLVVQALHALGISLAHGRTRGGAGEGRRCRTNRGGRRCGCWLLNRLGGRSRNGGLRIFDLLGGRRGLLELLGFLFGLGLLRGALLLQWRPVSSQNANIMLKMIF